MTTYDLSIFRPNTDGSTASQLLIGPGDSGEVVTGGAKLAQLYVILLLTPKGSIPYAVNRGSNFLGLLQLNGMFTEQDVFSSFSGAQLDLTPQLIPNTSAPLDEQFSKATLQRVTVTPDGLILGIKIFSQAGTGTLVQLPLQFSIQR